MALPSYNRLLAIHGENNFPAIVTGKLLQKWLLFERQPLDALVAQWIEYWPPKPGVVGSIPAERTISSPLIFHNCMPRLPP